MTGDRVKAKNVCEPLPIRIYVQGSAIMYHGQES